MGDAEDVGVGDGLGAQPGAHDVADAAADAGGAAAVGLDGAGVVVGFDFEADGVGFVEDDDAGVVLEDAEAERFLAFCDQIFGALENRLFDQVSVCAEDFSRFVDDLNGAFERFMNAVLAPGLGDRLQFDVGGLALLGTEVFLDGLHLGQREEQVAVAAELCELVVGKIAQLNVLEAETVFVPGREGGGDVAIEMDRFDDAVGEDAAGDVLELFGGQAGRE